MPSSKATPPAVLSRDAGHADVFVMGNDGRVWTNWWALNENNNRWNGWYPISDHPDNPAEAIFSKATPPAVLSRDAGHADVFVMGNDGRVWTNWWALNENNNRWNGWYPIGGLETVRLHAKVLTTPTTSIAAMVSAMQVVYAAAGVDVALATTEVLNNLPMLLDVDVAGCTSGTTTKEQDQLFENRNNVGDHDVVVYFVRSTVPPLNGCAAHPSGRPGAVVVQSATQWTLGHEVGHVLGLSHVNDTNRLMYGGGTSKITNPPPDLVQSEEQTMLASELTV
jgi:hypothetical protein